MSDQSHSYLPADAVQASCRGFIAAVHAERNKIRDMVMRDKRANMGLMAQWKTAKLSADELLEPGEKALYEGYHREGERRVSELLDLATATAELNHGLSIMVTASDFQLIKPYWEQTS